MVVSAHRYLAGVVLESLVVLTEAWAGENTGKFFFRGEDFMGWIGTVLHSLRVNYFETAAVILSAGLSF